MLLIPISTDTGAGDREGGTGSDVEKPDQGSRTGEGDRGWMKPLVA
jgi:hypothetical protein